MQKRLTVFYSWQSDTPSQLNRNFIEKALHEALKRLQSDATLEKALRDSEIELDKDTSGVAGSPPIADTILKKNEDCTAFVADVTFVGESLDALHQQGEKPRLFPNPNVILEYGYALRCHSHKALVSIMNTAYGEPSSDSLPFDLRHLRWPIPYRLTSSSSGADKPKEFEKLVGTLVEALKLILTSSPEPPAEIKAFVPQRATESPAVFFENDMDLVGDTAHGGQPIYVAKGGKAYLRLYPDVGVPAIRSQLRARDLAVLGGLQPMSMVSGYNYDRNSFGCLVYERPQDQHIWCFTQLFLSREIWGVDARMLHPSGGMPIYQAPATIPSGYLQEYFVRALHNYLTFAKSALHLPPPLHLEAGLTGIKGFTIAGPRGGSNGRAIQDAVKWNGGTSYDQPPWEILAGFFDLVWEECGTMRTQSVQNEFATKFPHLASYDPTR